MKKVLLLVTLFLSSLAAHAAPTKSYDVLSTGVFMTVDNRHMIEGSVRVEKRNDDLVLALNGDFAVSMGPDLRVVLRDSSGAHMMEVLAKLEKFSGGQEYKLTLPAEQLAGFDEVVIYCAKFHVDFGVAHLQAR